MQLYIVPGDELPIYRQIMRQITDALAGGRLGFGDKLPSQRDLAEQQGWAYSTVKTMLDRMVEKNLVKTRRVGNVYEYSPKVRRKSVVARVVDDVFDRVLEGSLTPFIDRLIEGRRLSKDEVDGLKQMLDKYSDETP